MSLPDVIIRRPRWYVEVVTLVLGYVAFGLARAPINRGDPAATEHALLIQGLERSLRLDLEYLLNHAMLASPVAMDLTGYFYRLCLLAVPATLIWLYLRRPLHYRSLRRVLVVVTLLDLPLVLLFPESPPRFAQAGVVDYMATRDILFSGASRDPHVGVNLVAAMPSMHVAWTTWCGYAGWTVLRPHRPGIAWLPWLLPLLTAVVVLLTGHHYVLDVVAAVALVAAVTRLTAGSWSARLSHRRADVGRHRR